MAFKVTTSKECPPNSGWAYRHYIAGNVYGPETDPPGTPFVEERAIREGWAIAWPPAEAPASKPPEPPPTVASVPLTTGTGLSGLDWVEFPIPAEALGSATFVDGSPLPEAERGEDGLFHGEPLAAPAPDDRYDRAARKMNEATAAGRAICGTPPVSAADLRAAFPDLEPSFGEPIAPADPPATPSQPGPAQEPLEEATPAPGPDAQATPENPRKEAPARPEKPATAAKPPKAPAKVTPRKSARKR